MADENGAGPERSGKPPAITVRASTWEAYDWITQAAAKREMSRGEFLLAGTLQRRTGGKMPVARKVAQRQAASASGNVHSSAEAKANVQPRPKGAR